jgi:diguanylate cyclase (GGDEF)-like protein/PAS domain S-box-containing protein
MTRILGFPKPGRSRGDAVAEAALEQAHGARRTRALLRAVERTSGIGHWHLDLRIDALYWSPQVFRIHGLAPGAFAPTPERASALCHEGDRERVAGLLRQVVREARRETFEMRILRADGAQRVVQCNVEPELDLHGQVAGVLGTFQDVTDAKAQHRRLEQQALALQQEVARRSALEEDLRRQALTDDLTGIANRRHFMAQAAMEMARSDRYLHPLSIVAFDLDLFKQINDTWGHAAGDTVIRDVAAGISAMLRGGSDLLGRLGGEEFAVLLPQTDGNAAAELAERMRAAVAAMELCHEGHRISVTCSFGVTQARQGDADVDGVLNRADEAVYQAKSSGRDRVCRR